MGAHGICFQLTLHRELRQAGLCLKRETQIAFEGRTGSFRAFTLLKDKQIPSLSLELDFAASNKNT